MPSPAPQKTQILRCEEEEEGEEESSMAEEADDEGGGGIIAFVGRMIIVIVEPRLPAFGLISFRFGPPAGLPLGHLWSHVAEMGLMINSFDRNGCLWR